MTGTDEAGAARLISIIGPPAVGKTTLAEALAEHLPAELVREDHEHNPFLAESYAGSARARLPNQLFFLLSRVAQLLPPNLPPAGLLVSDYGFCQDAIYARLRLAGGDYDSYATVLACLADLVHRPDVLICLDASVCTLLERIAVRGRSYESVMTDEFLEAMRQSCDVAAEREGCPVLRVDCETTDVQDPTALAGIIEQLREML